MKKALHEKRLEWLLFVLIMVLFNKIFVTSLSFYTTYVWPFNMVLLGIVSNLLFREKSTWLIFIKNFLFLIVVGTPFFASYIFSNKIASTIGISAYILFYALIFSEVMRQITRRTEVTTGIIFGSIAGFLLLTIIASFSFILFDFLQEGALKGITGSTVPERYHQYIYFTGITLSTIGYGDITPATDNTRLLAVFWGMTGQFYMVAVVGIIISKFTSKQH